jgi:abortive infection bacteriophage resistance protein
LPGRPKLLPNPPHPWVMVIPKESEGQMLYIHLCCMKYLLNIIKPNNTFTSEVLSLIKKYPTIDPKALGLKEDWQNEPLWFNS